MQLFPANPVYIDRNSLLASYSSSIGQSIRRDLNIKFVVGINIYLKDEHFRCELLSSLLPNAQGSLF